MSTQTHMSTHLCEQILQFECISRVPDQNGVSLLYIMLEMHRSGWEPSNYVSVCMLDFCPFSQFSINIASFFKPTDTNPDACARAHTHTYIQTSKQLQCNYMHVCMCTCVHISLFMCVLVLFNCIISTLQPSF